MYRYIYIYIYIYIFEPVELLWFLDSHEFE